MFTGVFLFLSSDEKTRDSFILPIKSVNDFANFGHMILVADSGSTSTDWRLANSNGKIHQFKSQGLNPHFADSAEVEAALRDNFPAEEDASEVTEAFFYGSGVSGDAMREVLGKGISAVCKNAKLTIENDLLGAARAACGTEPGIAAILGTGSNCCVFDGTEMVKNSPSLGFVLGDEGSGGHIGKSLLQAYFYGRMPDDLKQNFERRFPIHRTDVLEAVYRQPNPNRYIASYSKFVYQNLKHPFAMQLVIDCFSDFFDTHVLCFDESSKLKLGVTGSVGFYYGNILSRVARSKGVGMGRVVESPIAALLMYHLDD